MSNKPLILQSIWANDSITNPEMVEQPPTSKIESGWVWGEKPSHKFYNWNWNTVDSFTHHINSYGLPQWDSETEYEVGSVVLRNPFIYQANADNTNEDPIDDIGSWDIVGQTLAGLNNVIVDDTVDPSTPYVLTYDDTAPGWKNTPLSDITTNMTLQDLNNVETGTLLEKEVLSFNGSSNVWDNTSIKTAMSRDEVSSFCAVKDIQYKTPEPYDILKWDGNIWKIEANVIDTTSWDKVLNPRKEFPPPFASSTVFGGAKIYSIGTTLYINTVPTSKPAAPINVKTISSSAEIQLFWLQASTGERAEYFNVYRDSSILQSGVYDVVFIDKSVKKDMEYFYSVTGVNEFGESQESTQVIGHTFTQPSRPKNLTGEVNVNDIYLSWDTPDVISGNIIYKIFRNNQEIGTSNNLSYVDVNVSIGTYTYYVIASNKYYDSENSNSVIITKN